MTQSRITAIRTLRVPERPNILWVEIETAEGLRGLGEAFRGAAAVEGQIHELCAPFLLGRDARQIEPIHRHLMTPYVGFGAASAEIRAASAIDIALWDLQGQRLGVPVAEALGGFSRPSIRAYNTCAGYDYNSRGSRRDVGDEAPIGPYDDELAFTRDAGELAESLLAEGFTAMKIWPFDPFAAASGGQMITLDELNRGMEPFHKIRRAVGDRMEVMAELHSLWSLPAASRICQALVPIRPFWVEDPLCKMNDTASLAELRRAVPWAPICASETLGGKVAYRDLLVDPQSYAAALAGQSTFVTVIDPTSHDPIRIRTVPLIEQDRVIAIMQVAQSLTTVVDTLNRLLAALLLSVPLLVALAALGGYLLATDARRGDEGLSLAEVLTLANASPAKNLSLIHI